MLNSVILIGRLTHDPEISTTATGKEVTSFSIAVDRGYTNGGEKKTDFISCVAWENTARFLERHFSKGEMIAIQGQLQSRQYQDKQGNKKTAFEVLVREVSFCGNRPAAPVPTEGGVGDTGFSTASAADFDEITDDEY